MVAAFEGWNDAGDAATAAVDHLLEVWDAELVAALDPEDYYDFQVNRPRVARRRGRRGGSCGPPPRLCSPARPGRDRDVVLLRGHRAELRWRRSASS